jgi:hypothetical protein
VNCPMKLFLRYASLSPDSKAIVAPTLAARVGASVGHPATSSRTESRPHCTTEAASLPSQSILHSTPRFRTHAPSVRIHRYELPHAKAYNAQGEALPAYSCATARLTITERVSSKLNTRNPLRWMLVGTMQLSSCISRT